jgi:hypothetical protein
VAGMVDVMNYFEMKPAQFRVQWLELSETDKEQLKSRIENGSLTY